MVSLGRDAGEAAKVLVRTGATGWQRHARNLSEALKVTPVQSLVRPVLLALVLIGAMTLCLIAIRQFVELHHVTSAYLIPVLFAAIRLGLIPALIVACGGVAASAYIFYPPIYDFRVSDPEQLFDLPLFVVVAVVTSQLATRAQANLRLVREREDEMRALYLFSRKLAAATDAAQIYAAIQEHLSLITACRVIYFEAGARHSIMQHGGGPVPDPVRRAVVDFASQPGEQTSSWIDDERSGSRWLVCAVSRRNPAFGVVAIDIGRPQHHGHASMQNRIDAALADATATLERLDVARAIGEVKLRAEAETLRAALMGSVSHGLRTPLASIMGSASILVQAPAIATDPRLASLAGIVRDEAGRLNSDIQRLLDASRISTAGIRPHVAWADAADIVNAAIAHQARGLAAHEVEVQLAGDLPLVQVDPVLIEQALGQVLDNAAKYSPTGSIIRVEAQARDGVIAIAITDQGAGIAVEDRERIFDRFYRGLRTQAATSGSGLGLWIARAFVVACGGRIEVASEDPGRGTTVTILLPHAVGANENGEGDNDD